MLSSVLFQPLRPPAVAVPPSTLSAVPISASGDSGAPAPNLIDFDLSPHPPAAAQATENPFAPVNTNDISVQLASMSKCVLASMFLRIQRQCLRPTYIKRTRLRKQRHFCLWY